MQVSCISSRRDVAQLALQQILSIHGNLVIATEYSVKLVTISWSGVWEVSFRGLTAFEVDWAADVEGICVCNKYVRLRSFRCCDGDSILENFPLDSYF